MTKHSPDFEDIEEAELAYRQRYLLNRVRTFLTEHEADDELVEAIDQALDDNDQWLSPEYEALFDETGSPKADKPQ